MNNKATNMMDLVQAKMAGQAVPVINAVRKNPELAALASKLVHGIERPQYTDRGERKITAPDVSYLNDISVSIARKIRENKSLLQMLPDLELGFQILISSTLSPKDMVTLELIFAASNTTLPASIVGAIVKELKEYFENTYKIKRKLPDILRNIFAISGAHIEAVLPENAIDELINRHGSISLEECQSVLSSPEVNSSKGFLGHGNLPEGTAVPKNPMNFTQGHRRMNLALTSANENLAHYDIDAGKSVGSGTSPLVLKGDKSVQVFEQIQVTDNPAILRNNALLRKLRSDTVSRRLNNNKISAGLESMYSAAGGKVTDQMLTNLIYKQRSGNAKVMEVLKTQNQLTRSSVGEPVIMELPAEAVIPVITPGQENRHVAYFVLVDDTGNPVRADTFRDGYAALADRMRSNNSQNSNTIARLQNLTEGMACRSMADMYNVVRISTDLVEQDLFARLRNGMYPNGVALARNEDVARLMLSRMLQGQNSTILFLPVEAVTYFATRYNEQGIGVSLLDEMKIINSQRAVLMFANTMGGIKNSISRTEVAIKFDENDPDPQNTLEMQLDALMRANTNMFPLGVDSPSDIATYLGRAQWEIKWSGHPGMPDMGVEFNQKTSDHRPVDTALEESLRKYSFASLGLTVEMVDNGFNQETATAVVANNLLLTRRVLTIHEQINPHLTDHCQKVIRASQPLTDRLREAVSSNFKDLEINVEEIKTQLGAEAKNIDVKALIVERIVADFVDALEVSLPRPDTATATNQLSALETQSRFIDEGLKYIISDEFFTGKTGGTASEEARVFKEGVKALYMRKFMADNGILTELAGITNYTDKTTVTNPVWEEHGDHAEKLRELITRWYEVQAHGIAKSNARMDKVNAGLDGSASSGGSDYSSDDTSSGGDSSGGDDPFAADSGGDPFAGDGGFEAPSFDAPVDGEPKAEGDETPAE